MPLRPCLDCGALSTASRCPTHSTGDTSWNGTRDRSTQRRFAQVVMSMAGHRCQAVVSGERCPVSTGMQAHHTQPGNNDPATGVALCRAHHRFVDRSAR